METHGICLDRFEGGAKVCEWLKKFDMFVACLRMNAEVHGKDPKHIKEEVLMPMYVGGEAARCLSKLTDTTYKAMTDALTSEFKLSEHSTLIRLIERKFSYGESVSSYVGDIEDLVEALQWTPKESVVRQFVLHNLPRDALRALQANGHLKLSFTELKVRLKDLVSDMPPSSLQPIGANMHPASTQHQAARDSVNTGARGTRCFRCLETDHVVGDCTNRVKCHGCGGEGHIAKYCKDKAVAKNGVGQQ